MIIVIENTRCCNIKCKHCPVWYARNYPGSFMSMETFERILNHLDMKIEGIALTGWGEPLLDPSFFEKLSRLKRRGFIVGTTTNLTLMDIEKALKLSDEGLDQLHISWDLFHLESIKNKNLIKSKIEQLVSLKEKGKISYNLNFNVVVSSNDLDPCIELLEILNGRIKANVGIVPLIMIPNPSLLEKLINKKKMEELSILVRNRFKDLIISFPYLNNTPSNNCRSDVFSALYISYTGDLAPCCTLALDFTNCTFDKKCGKIHSFFIDSLKSKTLSDIWNSPAYLKFRETFKKGLIPKQCTYCNAWRELP